MGDKTLIYLENQFKTFFLTFDFIKIYIMSRKGLTYSDVSKVLDQLKTFKRKGPT